MSELSLAKEISTAEFADILQIEGDTHERRIENARRRMRKLGIARQDSPGGKVYTTIGDLQHKAAHAWAEYVRRGG